MLRVRNGELFNTNEIPMLGGPMAVLALEIFHWEHGGTVYLPSDEFKRFGEWCGNPEVPIVWGGVKVFPS